MKTLTKAFNTATVEKGETFRIELDANATTGYLWDVQLKAGAASLVSREYKTQKTPGEFVCGAAGIEEYVFKAEKSGTIELEAHYARPWEKGAKPADSRSFRIDVK